MNVMKPIETRYLNCKFRSRLEARWAAFFKACGIKFDYEAEGYANNNSPYLPDFLLHDVNIKDSARQGKFYDLYVEVKGDMTEEDIRKINDFKVYENGKIKNPLIVVGRIPANLDDMYTAFMESKFEPRFYSFKNIDNDNFPAYLTTTKNGGLNICEDYVSKEDRIATEEILRIASEARFEHGEHPEMKYFKNDLEILLKSFGKIETNFAGGIQYFMLEDLGILCGYSPLSAKTIVKKHFHDTYYRIKFKNKFNINQFRACLRAEQVIDFIKNSKKEKAKEIAKALERAGY